MFSIPVMPGVAEWINFVFAGLDQGVTLLIHKLYEFGGSMMTAVMNFISLLGMKGIFLILLSLTLLFFKKSRRYGTAMCIGLFIGVVLVNLFLKDAIARPRPYTVDFYRALWEQVGQNVESDFCFPSGHTNAAFAAMIPLFVLGNKKVSWLALVFGVLMGISRIYLVVHYPTDVIGGMITGTFSGMLGIIIALLLPGKWYAWDLLKKRTEEEEVTTEEEECLESEG